MMNPKTEILALKLAKLFTELNNATGTSTYMIVNDIEIEINEALNKEYERGLEEEQSDSYDAGWSDGYTKGYKESYDKGYNEGHKAGEKYVYDYINGPTEAPEWVEEIEEYFNWDKESDK